MKNYVSQFPRIFASGEAHRNYLRSIAALPRGFKVGVTSVPFASPTSGKQLQMRLTAIACERATSSFAAVLTRNRVCGAPIILARRRLEQSTLIGGIVINNRIANVVASGGVNDAERVCEAAARALGVYSGDGMFSLSTGVVGWPLPVDAMVSAMPSLQKSVLGDNLDALDAAESIMTTDQWPKVRTALLPGGARVVGIAKGAGMVEPNMATMLSVLMTDARVSRATLQRALNSAVNAPGSFNSCTVDSDTSTSDAVIALSSNVLGPTTATSGSVGTGASIGSTGGVEHSDDDQYNSLVHAMTQVCQGLANDVVRNGEGFLYLLSLIDD